MQRRKFIAYTINERHNEDPMVEVVANDTTLLYNEYPNKRLGRPRNNLWKLGIQEYWKALTENNSPIIRTRNSTGIIKNGTNNKDICRQQLGSTHEKQHWKNTQTRNMGRTSPNME